MLHLIHASQKGLFVKRAVASLGSAVLVALMTAPLPAAEPALAAQRRGTRVVLLDRGREPRARLRYRLAPRAVQRATLRMRLDVGLGEQPPTPMPAYGVDFAFGPTRRARGGRIEVPFAIEDARIEDLRGVDPAMAGPLTARLWALRGLMGTLGVDARGVIARVRMQAPPGLAPDLRQRLGQIRQSLETITVPLPAEPVGVGARWQVDATVPVSGARVAQRTIYTLRTTEAGAIEVGIEIAQSADDQPVTIERAGVQATLISLRASGTGEARASLAQLVPTSSLRFQSTSVIAVRGSGSDARELRSRAVVGIDVAALSDEVASERARNRAAADDQGHRPHLRPME